VEPEIASCPLITESFGKTSSRVRSTVSVRTVNIFPNVGAFFKGGRKDD